MDKTLKPRVKICCINSKEEARMAIKSGASAGNMPSDPGIIEDKLINEIAQMIPPGISSFLLTSETEVNKIIVHHKRVHTNTIQIVYELIDGQYAYSKSYGSNVLQFISKPWDNCV